MAEGQRRIAIDEILERLKRNTSDVDVTWELEDDAPSSTLEIIASNGWGVTVNFTISGD